MQIKDFARAVLLGISVEDKLTSPAELTDEDPGAAMDAAPDFPGRPDGLAVPAGAHANARAPFPDAAQLDEPAARGRLLHFFANHELLAMELMALVLLRFPDAPPAFRAGLARTIGEEQGHMRLYLARMHELGVRFGELPLSRYFWDAMAGVRSPLEFVVAMSLTFEQANLDFSAHYRDAVARTGDAATAALLDRVYREEIGHVKHGVQWFNRWRDGSENDWDSYKRLLPASLSPRRARGLSYQEDARREAGLSETFIRALAVQGGSRGRPRVVWRYNPLCEAEIARGGPVSPNANRARVARDLEHVPMFLADPQDVVLVSEPPRLAWLEQLAAAGFTSPDFMRPEDFRDTKIGGIEPWGWSPAAFSLFAPHAKHLTATPGGNADWAREVLGRGRFADTGLAPLYAKTWSAAFLRGWLEAHPALAPIFGPTSDAGRACPDLASASDAVRALLAGGRPALIKAPLGTAGTQSRKIERADELEGPAAGWMRRRLAEQHALIVEPCLERTADFSMQIEIADTRIRLIGLRRFLTGPRFEYRGTYLGSHRVGFSPEELRFLHEVGPCGRPVERFEECATAVGEALARAGYRGPAGIDALLHRAADGRLGLRPVVEVNPRWTMGRVALAMEPRMPRGAVGGWFFVPSRRLAELRLTQGLIWTSDPERAAEICTVLAVGEHAVRTLVETLQPT